MLGEPGGLVAELIGQPGLLGDLGEDLGRGLLGLARAHQVEDAEFHGALSLSAVEAYSLNWAARQRTAAGTPSASTISRKRCPSSVLVA